MYWYKFKEYMFNDEAEPDYVLMSHLTLDEMVFCRNYRKLTYVSPKFRSMNDMLEDFHKMVLLSKTEPIINFYNDRQYISNGRHEYDTYVKSLY